MAHPQLYWGDDGYYGYDAWLAFPFLKTETLTSNWGRNYHFLFAWVFVLNGLIYLLTNFFNKHFFRDLLPSREQLTIAYIVADIRDHLRLQPPRGEAAREYSVLQKLSYLVVVFVLCPILLVTGLSMSPGFTAVMPELLDLVFGRQSGRSIHFIAASLLVLFFVVHIAQVFIAGFINELRAMLTGNYVLPKENK